MVSSFHYSPSYSAYRTQDTTGAESGHGWSPTDCRKYAGDHGQDVNSTGTLLNAYSKATPRGPSFDPSSSLVDGVAVSQVSATVSNNVLCKIGLNVSAQMGPARDGHKCPACNVVFHRTQERKRHMLMHLPYWLLCPEADCAWRGDRWANLHTHHDKYHPSRSPGVDKNECIIYDPWPLVQGIIDNAITPQNAAEQAISLLEKKAVEVEKLGLWEVNFWGRERRKARKVRGPDDDKDVPKAGHDSG